MIAQALNLTQETFGRVWIVAALAIAFVSSVVGQSTLQEFPTAVTTTQINGSINARPIGDSRLTTYFYTFDGSQGDVFVNVFTKNFNGDFDIFIADGLRPISKIITLSGFSEYETGRVIYLRKQERLLLRVQGRTPDDEPATFQIKFAGSFVALNEADVPTPPELPTVSRRERSETVSRADVRESPQRIEDPEEKESAKVVEPPIKPIDDTPEPVREVPRAAQREVEAPVPAREVPKVAERDAETPEQVGEVPKADEREVEAPEPKISKPRVIIEDRTPERRDDRDLSVVAPRILNLVVEFLDGSKIETPMTEIRKFTVDGGRLIIVGRDGASRRYSMIDVVKVAIQ